MTTNVSTFVRNVSGIEKICFDIGSRSIKISYFSRLPVTRTTLQKTVAPTGNYLERLHCIQVDYDDFPKVLDYIAENSKVSGTVVHYAHTSRVHAVEDMIVQKLNVKLVCLDTFDCISRGTTFLLRNIEAEAYAYSPTSQEYTFKTPSDCKIFPYILVNIRTGVSFIRVDSDDKFTRVGGSCVGGGCFLGLSSLLTNEDDLEKLMEMAIDGEPGFVDKLISDVYGNKANTLGLPEDLLAASFAKAADGQYKLSNFSGKQKCSVISSLLRMIVYNLAQLAFLYASTENIQRVFFNGFLVRNRPVVMKAISFAFHYWTEGRLTAYFLRHENYTSAIGVFLSSLTGEIEQDQYWKEHYSGTTALARFVPVDPLTTGFKAQTLELDCAGHFASPFCLLSDDESTPDSIDFNKDDAARDFWLSVMEETIPGVQKFAIKSQENVEDKEDLQLRANGFVESFKKMLGIIKEHPVAYGNANARNILEFREQILKHYGFDDIYIQQKEIENQFAIAQLSTVLENIDKLKKTLTADDHFEYVCRGLLAGNVFDWGAKEVVKMMNREGGLSFAEAIDNVESRPWLFDDFDAFNKKSSSYNCALIFVDNSGCDYLLGVVPFARELMRKGTKTIICANSSPALNDLTFSEMSTLIKNLCDLDEELNEFITSGQMLFTENGQGSPCLDLRRVHTELNRIVKQHKVDLIVIEGMGRALHTNFNVQFKCDVLKVAVIKTKWLADRFGGKMFSVVFKFENGTEVNDFSESDEKDIAAVSFEAETETLIVPNV